MQLIIGKPIHNDVHRNVYKFSLEFLLERSLEIDAEESVTTYVYASKNNPFIERFMTFLENSIYGDVDSFTGSEDHEIFVEGHDKGSPDSKWLNELQIELPDVEESTLHSWKVTFFDETGLEHEVEIIEQNERAGSGVF